MRDVKLIKTQGEIILLSIKELFSFKMLKVAILPFVLTTILFYVAFFYLMSSGDFTHSGFASLDYWLEISAVVWIVTILGYIFGIFVIFWAGLIIAVLIVGLFTPYIIKHIQNNYYPNIQIDGYNTVLNSITFTLKTLFIMLILFLVLLPFYFIPVINILAINLPLFYFFHKILHFDVMSNMVQKEKALVLRYRHGTKFRVYSLFLYILSMIPFVMLIIPVFYILYLTQNYFEIIKDSQTSNETILIEPSN